MTVKPAHEIRDPIHTFVRVTTDEREVIDSRPVQRLRHIHQLATTYMVYPGATHRRFEHSLGVMELASRVYDVVTDSAHLHPEIVGIVPKHHLPYWRDVLRVAALMHDTGHLPFSHAAEHDLLPERWDHERLTYEIIHSDMMCAIWKRMKLQPEDIAKIAVGPEKYPKYSEGETLDEWEAIVSEILTGDAFGVDRMDYLLRDSHHAGVAYGRFDHHRLVDCLRILPRGEGDSKEPMLGVEHGGIYGAEALLLARYLMFAQVYYHPVRIVYDIHLKDFLRDWLKDGVYPTDVAGHLSLTDNEVTSAMLASARGHGPGHEHAKRLVERQHFKVLYERNPNDIARNPEAVAAVYGAACGEFGESAVRQHVLVRSPRKHDFAVLENDGRIASSVALSATLSAIPEPVCGYVYIRSDLRETAREWLKSNLDEIIQLSGEEA